MKIRTLLALIITLNVTRGNLFTIGSLLAAALWWGTPGIILLAVWCLICQWEANEFRRLLCLARDSLQAVLGTHSTHNSLMAELHSLPNKPEDAIRREVLGKWNTPES